MKKTFRKAIACLLAVLMVAFSFPFTALATSVNRQWWVAENLENVPGGITEEPVYEGHAFDADWEQEWGAQLDMDGTLGVDFVDHREDFKPIVAMTVTKQGDESSKTDKNQRIPYYNKYYGQSKSNNYDTVADKGFILNPAQLEAGTRIAVTFEIGGVDMLNAASIKGTFDKTKLAPAYYTGSVTTKDTWAIQTSGARSILKNAGGLYGTDYFSSSNNLNPAAGTFLITAIAGDTVNGIPCTSTYCGTGADERANCGAEGCGKYGIIMGVMSFEVLENCDLTEAISFKVFEPGEDGTMIVPYSQDSLPSGEPYVATPDGGVTDNRVFAKMALVWDSYEASGDTPATHTHEYTSVVTAPTCTEKGYTTWTCANTDGLCDAVTYVDSYVDATGHTEVSADNAVAATCTEAGKEADTVCSVCGETLAEGAVVPATGHTEVSADNAVAATCTEAGKEADTVCSVCGETLAEGAVVPATGHTEVSANNAVAATCTEAGKEADTVCDVCGALIAEGAVIDAPGHTWDDGVVTTQPTETSKGVKTFTCTVCNETRTEEIPELDHTHVYTSVVTAPTCTEQGYTTWTCACGDTYVDSYVDATGHTEVSADNAVAATCTEAGKEADTVCSVCGETLAEGAVIAALGHTEVSAENAVAATCTEAGKEADTVCSVCGETLAEGAVIAALGHTEVSADNAVAATCTEAGKEADTVCSVCGETLAEGAVIAAPGHTPVSADNAVEATFDAPGKEADTVCSVCGALIEEGAVIPQLEGYTVEIVATDLGTTTLDGAEATDGLTKTVAKNSTVALTATPVDGATFLGWKVGNKIVTDKAEYTATVLNNVVIEPVFTVTTASNFTVVFMDSYGNVIDTQTVESGADIVAPVAPARIGYTFAGWSLTDAEIAALTEGASIVAKYDNAVTTYTVTATGCDITVGAETVAGTTTVSYNTKVTVTKEGTDYWTINGATVAYGDTYSFYVGSDVEVVPCVDSSVVQLPTVTKVSVDQIDSAACDVVFLATRNIPDGYTLVRNGFVYGKALVDEELTLDNVGNTGSAANAGKVKVIYNSTTSNQFSLTYGVRAMDANACAKAFLVCKNAAGEQITVYSEAMIFTY